MRRRHVEQWARLCLGKNLLILSFNQCLTCGKMGEKKIRAFNRTGHMMTKIVILFPNPPNIRSQYFCASLVI